MKSTMPKIQVKTARKNLSRAYVDRPHSLPVIRIASYPITTSDVINMSGKLYTRNSVLDYLHKLGLATFCARDHPICAAKILYTPLQNRQELLKVITPPDTVCDCCIGNWQLELLPAISHNSDKNDTAAIKAKTGRKSAAT